MSSFKKKQNDRYVLKKADIDFYKMTGVFAIACVFVLLVLKMQDTGLERIASGKNLTHNFYSFCHTPLFAVISLVALAGAVAWFAYCKAKKVDETYRIFSSTNCLAVVLYLGFFSACFGLRSASSLHSFFIVVTICLALLYYSSKIYNIDFVVYSSMTLAVAVAVYLWAMRFETHMVILKLIIAAAGIAVCVMFKKNVSGLKISKHRKESFLIFPCYIALIFGIVFMFWAYFQNMEFFRTSDMLMSIQRAIFLNRSMMLIVVFAQYIVFAVVYTVRRIKD
ncbi:MAG: hypothetical protein IJZ20_04150 [Clostridia bacterium]|nr:hypothetical protein [Clostridia bacterium]MBQ8758867.1 hypothetical protein [Clostridia bacterium]